MNPARVSLAKRWAKVYRDLGYNPLPSDPAPESEGGRKKPLCRFADWWESPAPADLFDRFPTTNIQLMTGRHWGLCVLDLDGPEAVRHVERNWPRLPRTWCSYHTGESGRHLWFRLPEGLPERRKSVLWRGTGKHSAVELLCDRCLVVAPPSIHPGTSNVYGFDRACSPLNTARPAMASDWLLAKKSVDERLSIIPKIIPLDVSRCRVLRAVHSIPINDHRHLLGLIPDKVAVAAGWGLRLAGGGSGGWLYCHAIDREDKNPSAQFHPESGTYWEPSGTIRFFDLGAILCPHLYRDWRECRDALSAVYLPIQVRTPGAYLA